MIKEKNWGDVSIADYFKIIDIANDEAIEGIAKDVEIIALLYGLDVNEVWDMSVSEVNQYRAAIEFISNPPVPTKASIKAINVNGRKCTVYTDLNNFTYAQYVDFQEYWRKPNNLVDVLSVLIVPDGEKYGKYDVVEFKRDIEKYINVELATTICSFFLKSLMKYLKHSLQYLEKQVKIMKAMPLKKTEKEKETLREAMERITEIKYIVGLH